MNLAEYARQDATALATLIRGGEVSAREVLECAVSAAKQLNPRLNAVCEWMVDQAFAELERLPAGAPLAGVPFMVKDLLIQLEGRACTQGSRLVRPVPAPQDSELMRRFRQCGLVAFAKTTTPAFGAHVTTEGLRTGDTLSPWSPAHSCGGSSGGSAAAVAAGIVPLAHANDGNGSIRIPASACNLFGLKPTRQRTPSGPYFGDLLGGRGAEFVVSRSVRDAALVLDLVHGPDAGAPSWAPPPARPFLAEVRAPHPPLRIAFWSRCYSGAAVHPDCRLAVETIARLCESLGHHVVEMQPDFDWIDFNSGLFTIVASGTHATVRAAQVASGVEMSPETMEPHLQQMWAAGARIQAHQVHEAQQRMAMAQRAMGRFFAAHDILITPMLSRPPARIGELTRPELDAEAVWRIFAGDDYSPFASIFNVTGQPAASVPVLINADGLPIGVQIAGAFGREDHVLALASQIELTRPWSNHRPGFFAGNAAPDERPPVWPSSRVDLSPEDRLP